MAYFLEFEHRLASRRLDEAYAMILRWLEDQGAKVKEARPPDLLEAVHGRALQPMGWRKDARKTMAFGLVQQGSDVLVTVKITPPFANASDVRSRTDEARANWNELLAELWVRFGEAQAVREAVMRPPVDWNLSLRRGKGMMMLGTVLLVGGLPVTFFLASLTGGAIVIAPIGGALALLNGWMTVRSAKTHLARQGQAVPAGWEPSGGGPRGPP